MTNRGGALVCLITFGILLAPSQADSQLSPQARVEIGRVQHRVHDDGLLEASSGTVFGGAVGLLIQKRLDVWGEVRGGRLEAQGTGDDRDLAEVQIVAQRDVSDWLRVHGGASMRSYSSSPFRQRWAMLQLGAEAGVPLAWQSVRGVLRGEWMPTVSVTGIARPNVALATGAGVEWQGSHLSAGVLYTLEWYDFPMTGTTKRLEEVASLRFQFTGRLGTRLQRAK